MNVDATTRHREGVTLVELVVENEAAEPRAVRVENRLDGPVWFPRRHGAPAAGWDADGYAGEVPARGRLALGYASPAPPADPPVAVTSPSDAAESAGSIDRPEDVVAALGDPRPPRDAVPASGDGDPPGHGAGARDAEVPGAVADWLADVERRRDAAGPSAGDERALAAVADRIAALRSGR